MLSREVNFIYDYGVGAGKFIKGVAKELGLKDPYRVARGMPTARTGKNVLQ